MKSHLVYPLLAYGLLRFQELVDAYLLPYLPHAPNPFDPTFTILAFGRASMVPPMVASAGVLDLPFRISHKDNAPPPNYNWNN